MTTLSDARSSGADRYAPRIYTLGYWGRPVGQLIEFADRLRALVLDVRRDPRSSHQPDWNCGNLEFLLESRYRHAHGLGNDAPDGEPFRLIDPDRWLVMIEKIINRNKSAILLCACKYPEKCHRSMIADIMSKRGFITEHILHDDLPAEYVPESLCTCMDIIDGEYTQRSDITFLKWIQSTRNSDSSIWNIARFFANRLFGPQAEETITEYENGLWKSWHSDSDRDMTLFDFLRIIDHSDGCKNSTLADCMYRAWNLYRGTINHAK